MFLSTKAKNFLLAALGGKDKGSEVVAAVDASVVSVPTPTADPGSGVALPSTQSASFKLTVAGAETNTLAAPTAAGLRLIIVVAALSGGGARAITSASKLTNAGSGNTVLTFDAVGEMVVLESFDVGAAIEWRIMLNIGSVALS